MLRLEGRKLSSNMRPAGLVVMDGSQKMEYGLTGLLVFYLIQQSKGCGSKALTSVTEHEQVTKVAG